MHNGNTNTEQQRIRDLTCANPRNPMAVVAGPGTGKTASLILRLSALIDTGIPPHEIACITFTNASTREMQKRISQLEHPHASECTIQTFHRFLLGLLRMQIHATPFRFVAEKTWEAYMRFLFLEKDIGTRPPVAIADPHLMTLILELVRSHHRIIDAPPPKDPLIHWCAHTLRTHYLERDCPIVSLWDIETYFWLMLRSGKLPYFPYTYLLIDEFQDTSQAQYDICMHYLTHAHATLFVVGDAKQSIYAFRKANVENFLAIQEDILHFGGHVIHLTHNYRSHPEIVACANTFHAMFLTDTKDPLLQAATALSATGSVEMVAIPSDARDSFLVRHCTEAITHNQTVAILFRTTEEVTHLFHQLPCDLRMQTHTSLGHHTFLTEHPFAKGLLWGYLHALHPTHPIYAYGWNHSAWVPKSEAPAFSLHAASTLQSVLALATAMPTDAKDLHILQEIGEIISEAASLFLPMHPHSLEQYLLSLLDPWSDMTLTLPTMGRTHSPSKPITLSTLHGAKGLEFDTVILPITRKSMPTIKRYPHIFMSHGKLGYRTKYTFTDTEYTFIGDYETLQKKYQREQRSEELRLLYVGITRAKTQLVICYTPEEVPKIIQPWVDSMVHSCHRLLGRERAFQATMPS